MLALLLCSAAIFVLGVRTQSDDGIAQATPASAEATAGVAAAKQRQPFVLLKPQDSWVLEICAIAFLAALLINMAVGRSRNEKLAVAWTTEVHRCHQSALGTAGQTCVT